MKLYLKKLLVTFLFFAAFIVLAAVLCTLVIQFAFWFKPQLKTIIYIGLILSATMLLYIVFLKRWENKSLKAKYLEIQAGNDYSFRKDYLSTIKSKENVIHTLAFLSIAFLNSVRIAISAHRPLASLLLQVAILLLLFATLNTLVWCFVHKKWYKSRCGTKLTS